MTTRDSWNLLSKCVRGVAGASHKTQIMLAVFLVNDATGKHRGIFWKGDDNAHRTPSMWLLPNDARVTFRVRGLITFQVL